MHPTLLLDIMKLVLILYILIFIPSKCNTVPNETCADISPKQQVGYFSDGIMVVSTNRQPRYSYQAKITRNYTKVKLF